MMNWGRLRSNGNDHVFKGSQLVSCILERHQKRFRSRAAALKFSRQLFNDGVIKSVFGATTFEDSVQLYTWNEQTDRKMTSHSQSKTGQAYQYGRDVHITKRELLNTDKSIVDDVRNKISNKKVNGPSTNSYLQELDKHMNGPMNSNPYFHDTERGLPKEQPLTKQITSYQTSWNLQRASTSSDSSADNVSHSYPKPKEKHSWKPFVPPPSLSQSRDHDVIPEETLVQDDRAIERTAPNSFDLDRSSSNPRSVGIGSSPLQEVDETMSRRLHDFQNSYSDNEKQLIEQMKRMKKEHSHILRTYEDRINKLMAKMHELRSIAEMLENSSTKSSPYGTVLPPNKAGMLTLLGAKLDSEERKTIQASAPGDLDQQAPPLPPRPGRENRQYPSKPLGKTTASMTTLPWTRVLLKDEGRENQSTIWHTMTEPKLDPDDIERLFSKPELNETDGATLYDDLIIRRGRARQQLVSIYDCDRSKKMLLCMRCLRATLTDIIATVSSLDVSQINHDRLAELVELIVSVQDIEKILHYVRKKGAGLLDHPEYLVFELSKVDHFQDRLEFIRFRYKMQWNLFDIDQQLRELYTACDEVTNSISLKNLLETLLSVGNYLNSGTDMGQADGYGLDILNKLKDTQDRDDKGTLLEFVLKTYCQIYENEVDIGCPTRFRLPEPSNMRHAAQVSFDVIQDALATLHTDLRSIRGKLLDPAVNKDTTRPMDSFRVTAENFFAAALEVMSELDKVLQNTQDFFNKTVKYFILESTSISPQQFFQVWAVFLHDCKYYWKLAHKRLARERFELEFNYKGQLSACSLQGYGSFRAGVLTGLDYSAHPNTSTQQRHVNTWVQNLTHGGQANVPPKPAQAHIETEEVKPTTQEVMERSPSPKPLTATPPTSGDVHKPHAKALVPNGQILHSPPNYENQSEVDRMIPKYSQGNVDSAVVSPETSQKRHSNVVETQPKKSQQFSLKTWLKREREQVRKGVDHEIVGQQDTSKPQSPSRSFAKLKNSMFQRFSTSSNKKVQINPKPHYDNKLGSTSDTNDAPERHESPYDVLKNNYHGQKAIPNMDGTPLHVGNTNYRDSDYHHESPEAVISPIDDPDQDSLPFPYGIPNLGATSPDNPHANVHHANQNGDPNNNDNFIETMKQSTMNCNVDIISRERPGNTGCQNQLEIVKKYRSPTNTQYLPPHPEETPAMVSHVTDDYGHRQPVPQAAVYKMRNEIHNYEPQRQFDQRNVQATDNEFTRTKNTANVLREETGNHVGDSYNSPLMNGSIPNEDTYRHSARPAAKPARGRHVQSGNDKNSPHDTRREQRIDKQKCMTPGARVPMNAHSIGSLINRFDKHSETAAHPSGDHHTSKPTPRQSKPTGHQSKLAIQSKPETMTSTPVANRKVAETNSGQSEVSPPLPPRNEQANTVISPVNATINTPSYTDRFKHNDKPSNTPDYPSPYGKINFSNSVNMSNNISPANYNSPSSYKTPSSNLSVTNYTPSTNNYTPNPYKSAVSHHSVSTPYASTHQPHIDTTSKLTPGRLQYGDEDGVRDDGYKAQLRRAANTSAFDRYGKLGTPYSGRPSTGSITSQTSFLQSPMVRQGPTAATQENVAYMEI